jgi:GxxExxY protein
VETEKPVPVFFEEIRMDCGYRADIVVERMIIVDTKTIEAIGLIQISQLLTYLRFLNLRKGLILNFNTVKLKDGIKRVIRGYESNETE